MSDDILRRQLIRLAHAHPEFRKDILPLVKEGCGVVEAPAMARFEEGKPADPTQHMSPEDKKKWWEEHEKNKDQFKGAASDREIRAGLIRLAHAHPEFRKDILLSLLKQAEEEEEEAEGKEASSKKQAGAAVVRRVVTMTVRVLRYQDAPGGLEVFGQMSLDFGGQVSPDAVRFTAGVARMGDRYIVQSFSPIRTVSGGGAEIILGVLRSALQEAFDLKGDQLLGTAADRVPSLPV